MYQIYADGALIYDSTLDDYKIGKGQITLEVNKSGSFVFSVYPDHFYYDRFVQLKTVVVVKKSGRIVFRGRVLSDEVDYWNNKVITCEGELGFLQDSIVRPFEFSGTPAAFFSQWIQQHNDQVDSFKQFKVGKVTVVDSNDTITRYSQEYANTMDSLTSRTVDSTLGGYLYITHGDDGTEETPTLHWLADFTKTASQGIEFGVNLKNYTRTVKSADAATAVIPLGTETGSGGERLTIESVNDGVDYLYDAEAVALRGWVFKTVTWDDVILAQNLKTKGQAWLDSAVNLATTIELTAIDLHLLDRSIESYNVCEYVHATSKPHGFDAVMLCNKQTMDLLNPDNDTVTLGYQTATFTDSSTQMAANVSALGKRITEVKQDADAVALKAADLESGLETTLRVAADGVTITDADGNTVTIDGSQIKANSITADKLNITGSISFGDLDASTQTTINNASSNASSAISLAANANSQVSAWTYSGSTYIDGSKIMTGTVMASQLLGGTVGLLAYDKTQIGAMEITYTSTGFGISINTTSGGIKLESAGNVYLSAGSGAFLTLGESGNGTPICQFGGTNAANKAVMLIPGGSYGDTKPTTGVQGQVFFELVS